MVALSDVGSLAAVRRALAVLLAALLAAPPGPVASAASSGTIQGSVRLQGRPLSGVTVAFIELESGAVVRATSGADGRFEAKAAPGEYAVTTESQAGLTVDKAPVKVAVVPGEVATATLELMAVPTAMLQEPPSTPPAEATAPPPTPAETPPEAAAQIFAETTGTGAQIRFEPVTCFVAGEFPLLDAGVDPLEAVARARVYFHGAAGTSFYYVEMTQESGRFFGKLPRPRVEASPITYYLQSTTTQFEEAQTREIEAIVVEKKDECGDRKVAAFGPPGAVTVFSAATGASIALPAGFAVGGAGLAIGAIVVIAGAAIAGVGGAVVTAPATPPPPVIVVPSPIPIPTPIPQPSPTPVTSFR